MPKSGPSNRTHAQGWTFRSQGLGPQFIQLHVYIRSWQCFRVKEDIFVFCETNWPRRPKLVFHKLFCIENYHPKDKARFTNFGKLSLYIYHGVQVTYTFLTTWKCDRFFTWNTSKVAHGNLIWSCPCKVIRDSEKGDLQMHLHYLCLVPEKYTYLIETIAPHPRVSKQRIFVLHWMKCRSSKLRKKE